MTTILYRCPGKHLVTNGVTFDTLGIELADVAKALADGWHETLPAAIEAFQNPAAVIPADDAPPTRAEMLEQAEKLGIKVDKRWSDETLLAKIAEALK